METYDPITTKRIKESCMNRGFLLRTVHVLDSVGAGLVLFTIRGAALGGR